MDTIKNTQSIQLKTASLFFKMGQTHTFLFIFILFTMQNQISTNLTMNDKFVDGVLGTRTWGCRGQVQANPLSYGGTPK